MSSKHDAPPRQEPQPTLLAAEESNRTTIYRLPSAAASRNLQLKGISRRYWQNSLRQLEQRFHNSATLIKSLRREGKRLVTLTVDGRVMEPNGQLLLEFDDAPAIVLSLSGQHDPLDAAVELEEDGHLHDAAAAYEAILSANADDAQAWFNLGNVFYRLEELESSRKAFERAITIAPHDAACWNNLGVVLWEQNLRREARRHWQKALLLDSTNGPAAENLQAHRLAWAANHSGY